MKFLIKKKTARPFRKDDGTEMPYFWYKAVRQIDGVTLDFGSKVGHYSVGDELDLELEKSEVSGGKFRYKDLS